MLHKSSKLVSFLAISGGSDTGGGGIGNACDGRYDVNEQASRKKAQNVIGADLQ
jgi:hypothetical protein